MKDFVKTVAAVGTAIGIAAVVEYFLRTRYGEDCDDDDVDYDDEECFEDEDDEDYDGEDETLEYDEDEFDELMSAQYDEGYDSGYDVGYADALRELSYIGNNPAALALQEKLADMEEEYYADDDAVYGGVDDEDDEEGAFYGKVLVNENPEV